MRLMVRDGDMADYSRMDLNQNGVVSEEEITVVKEMRASEKMDAQRHMAWVAMVSMIFFTMVVFLPIFPDGRIQALSDLFGLFYIGQAGVVGAYMGMTAYMSKKR